MILRLPQLLEAVGLSKSSLWRLVKANEFPQPVRLGPPGTRAIGWKVADVTAWMDGLDRAA